MNKRTDYLTSYVTTNVLVIDFLDLRNLILLDVSLHDPPTLQLVLTYLQWNHSLRLLPIVVLVSDILVYAYRFLMKRVQVLIFDDIVAEDLTGVVLVEIRLRVLDHFEGALVDVCFVGGPGWRLI